MCVRMCSRGPACGPELRAIIRAAARRQDWTLSVDLVACGENSLCPRFYSRYPDAAAAATNALAVPCWNASSCPACGLRHLPQQLAALSALVAACVLELCASADYFAQACACARLDARVVQRQALVRRGTTARALHCTHACLPAGRC